MSDQRNLILAIVLSVLIILGFQFLYEGPRMRDAQQRAQDARPTPAQTIPQEAPGSGGAGGVGAAPGAQTAAPTAAATADAPRIPLDNGRIEGSISLMGARI